MVVGTDTVALLTDRLVGVALQSLELDESLVFVLQAGQEGVGVVDQGVLVLDTALVSVSLKRKFISVETSRTWDKDGYTRKLLMFRARFLGPGPRGRGLLLEPEAKTGIPSFFAIWVSLDPIFRDSPICLGIY